MLSVFPPDSQEYAFTHWNKQISLPRVCSPKSCPGEHNINININGLIQFGTQVKFRWSCDHNIRTADNAFSTPWYYSEMELEPVAG